MGLNKRLMPKLGVKFMNQAIVLSWKKSKRCIWGPKQDLT
jgi:hypothetical protein